MSSEAQARITVNRMLEEAGWRFLPDGPGRRENIICEHRVTRRAFAPNLDLGKDFEHAPSGFVDYVLLNTDQRPVAVVEAKRESIDPLTAKEQARSYAESLGVAHIFLSNGLVHYYWNLRQGNPVKVSRFLPLEHLGKAAEWRPDSARLAAVTVDEHYIAVSQDGGWLSYSPADRAAVMLNRKIRLLLDYQVDASRKHATKLVTLLNEEATRRWTTEYAAGSTFATQVTSDIPGAQQMTTDFANNNLNGKSKWQAGKFRDYDTNRTRVCVTVGMMTTGYDCEDVLNVALARPIFSPTDFIQIKGRGTRLYTFKHGDGVGQRTAKKDGFALFDFFANYEYFEEEFDYDKKLELPKGPPEEGDGGSGGGGTNVDDFTSTSVDPMTKVIREEVGLFGMKIDREMFRERFAQQAGAAVASDAALRARDPNLFGSLKQLAPPEREAWVAYLQSQVRLREFELVA
jgi:hypothetical protein